MNRRHRRLTVETRRAVGSCRAPNRPGRERCPASAAVTGRAAFPAEHSPLHVEPADVPRQRAARAVYHGHLELTISVDWGTIVVVVALGTMLWRQLSALDKRLTVQMSELTAQVVRVSERLAHLEGVIVTISGKTPIPASPRACRRGKHGTRLVANPRGNVATTRTKNLL